MLHTSFTSTAAAMRRISSTGVRAAYSRDSSQVSAPGMRKPTVITLRRKGRRLACSGWPGLFSASSGHSSLTIWR